MKSKLGLSRGWWALLGLGMSLGTGCQTWVGGMTLPSGHYLEHPPQFFPPTPSFPLTRELAAQEAINAAPPTAGAALPPPVVAPNLPPAVPVPPVPVPDVPPPPM